MPPPSAWLEAMFPKLANGGPDVAADEIVELTRLYDCGLYVQAAARADAVPPVAQWRGTAARLIAGRIANNVHAPRLGTWLHLRAWRDDHSDPVAAYFYASEMSRRRGPLAAWRFLQRLPPFAGATAEQRADLLTEQAELASQFRDFETATSLMEQAEALAPTRAWLWVEKGYLLERQDDYEGALAAIRQALLLRPWYRPAVQGIAHLLQLSGRDDEALALLEDAAGRLESAGVLSQLAALQVELGRHSEALASWERVRALSPWMEPRMIQWWEGRMSDAHYLCGNLPAAAASAARAKNGFFDIVAPRLASPPADGRRVLLSVEFVRQHHMTCAPATLSALSRFWQMPVDHLALAATICYDGTPGHIERHWAEQNGWHVREFRVTWETARALLDRAIPFAMTTVETQSAHLQALIGYDSFRGTLLVRDPYERTTGEWLATEFLERQAANGPRGLVLVPAAEASRLDGFDLPDAEVFDDVYRLERALHVYDREAAEQHFSSLERRDASHRLTLFARRYLAWYDASLPHQLAAVEELLLRYPENANFLWSKANALRELSRRAEYREFLHATATAKDSDPLFWREWAEELGKDARETFAAERQLKRCLRFRPLEADNLRALANLLWDRRQFAEATELYRLAACLRDKVEFHARSYFTAARHLRQTEKALGMLARRFEKFGRQSATPARILFWALTALNREPEAFVKLDEALALRPEDGELVLFAADAYARHGDPARASSLLAAAEKRTTPAEWLRSSARIADYTSRLHESLACWRRVLEEEPLALDAHRSVTRLLAETVNRAAALAHLQATCERFSHHVPLHQLWVEWARGEGDAEAERVLRLLLALDPRDAWARRELALALAGQRRFDEAHVELAAAEAIEPNVPQLHSTRGRVLLIAGRYAEARESCRAALRLAIDEDAPAADLLAASRTHEEKCASLAFIREELIRQVVFGDGLLTYRREAFGILDSAELLASLREALDARPDLWHAWSAVVLQLTDMQQVDEALTLAQQCTERFPLLPRVWLDLAQVHRFRGEREKEIPPLRRTLQLSPAWGWPSRLLADTYGRMGQYDESSKILEQAIAAAPLDSQNHGHLAEVLDRLGRREEAIARIEQALRLDPSYDWAWDKLREWSPPSDPNSRAVALAREISRDRSGEARSWLALAQVLGRDGLDECLGALDRANRLDPLYTDACDYRAWVFAEAGRYDEAAAACEPEACRGDVPTNLRGRAAWVEARRGNLRAATAKMLAVVEHAPDYYWGWNQIADWAMEDQNYQQARDAAERMARLAPRNAIPLGYLADAQSKLGQHDAALASLRRAFEIDPTYEFAGLRLFDHHLEKNDFAEAERFLGLLQTHLPGSRTLLAELRLRARRRREDEAYAVFERLCCAPEADGWAIKSADEALANTGWVRRQEEILFAHLHDPAANPEVGAVWVRRAAALGKWKRLREIRRIDPSRALGERARIAYVEVLGQHKRARDLSRFMRKEHAWLQGNAIAWGSVAYALVEMKRYRTAVKWMDDWRTHAGIRPWMLQNLIASLRELGRDTTALEASRKALTLPRDQTTPQHQLWIALDEVSRGETDSARSAVAEMRDHELSTYTRALLQIIRSVLEVQAAAPDRQSRKYKEERQKLRAGEFYNSYCDPVLRRAYRRCQRAMGRIVGRPIAGWFYSWLPVGPAPTIPSAAIWILIVLILTLIRACDTSIPR